MQNMGYSIYPFKYIVLSAKNVSAYFYSDCAGTFTSQLFRVLFLFDVFSDIVFWETALKSNYIHIAEIIKAKGVYRVPLY